MKTSLHQGGLRSIVIAAVAAFCLLTTKSFATIYLGNVSTATVNRPALLYQQTDRFEFTTQQTGNSSSGIAVFYLNAGNGSYDIDLYQNGVQIGSTALFGGAYFSGSHGIYVDQNTSAAVLPLAGLPPGTYNVIVSRGNLFGTNSAYVMQLAFPGNSTGGGTTGGGTTGGGTTGGGTTGGGSTGGGNTGGGTSTTAKGKGAAGSYGGVLTVDGGTLTYGQVELQVSPKSTFSGKVTVLGRTTRLKGELQDGSTTRVSAGGFTLALTPDFAAGTIAVSADVKGKAAAGRLDRSRYGRGNPCPAAGKCQVTATTSTEANGLPHPTGDTTLALRVTKAGRFACSGKLGGVEAFSTSGIVQSAGGNAVSFGFASTSRKHKDLVQGTNGQASGGGGNLTAQFTNVWTRGADDGAKTFPRGFSVTQNLSSGQ